MCVCGFFPSEIYSQEKRSSLEQRVGEAVSVSDITVPDSFPKVCSRWRCHLHGATYKTGGYRPLRGAQRLPPSF